MVDFKTRVYHEENNKIIGAEVIVYSEEGDRIGNIQITSKKDFDDLINRIDGFDETFVEKKDLQNLVNQLTIDAATLDGYSSPDFALRDHSHNREYAKTNHADSENSYGLASNSLFGHVKLIDNLNQTSFKDGLALSANQGKILDDKINSHAKNNQTWTKVKNGTYITVYYNSSLKLCYCIYERENYTGFNKADNVNETIIIHGENTIPKQYQPPTRVLSPLFRPDIVMSINPDGSIRARSAAKLSTLNIYCCFMWVVL